MEYVLSRAGRLLNPDVTSQKGEKKSRSNDAKSGSETLLFVADVMMKRRCKLLKNSCTELQSVFWSNPTVGFSITIVDWIHRGFVVVAQRDSGFEPDPAGFACSPRVCLGFQQVLQFLVTVPRRAGLIMNLKMTFRQLFDDCTYCNAVWSLLVWIWSACGRIIDLIWFSDNIKTLCCPHDSGEILK